MDIDRFKQQHVEILERIAALRKLAHAGVEANAQSIAQQVKELGALLTRHLAIEDRILYPAVQRADDPQISEMGAAYQREMKGIANAYIKFTNKWSVAANLTAEPRAFRDAANDVLKTVYLRMQRENHEFYPAIEQI